MVSFVVGGPAWDMEIREPLFREFVGLVAIEKCKPGIWVLHFVDKESATAAQWQLDLNGAHGITREEKKMGWNEFVEYLWNHDRTGAYKEHMTEKEAQDWLDVMRREDGGIDGGVCREYLERAGGYHHGGRG